ncbi:hypothetical protein MACH05_00930 [Qipengyuania nanhaisediminis]
MKSRGKFELPTRPLPSQGIVEFATQAGQLQFAREALHSNPKGFADVRLPPVQLIIVILASEVNRWCLRHVEAKGRNTSRERGCQLLRKERLTRTPGPSE